MRAKRAKMFRKAAEFSGEHHRQIIPKGGPQRRLVILPKGWQHARLERLRLAGEGKWWQEAIMYIKVKDVYTYVNHPDSARAIYRGMKKGFRNA